MLFNAFDHQHADRFFAGSLFGEAVAQNSSIVTIDHLNQMQPIGSTVVDVE